MSWEMVFVRFDCTIRHYNLNDHGVSKLEGRPLVEIIESLLRDGWEPFYYGEGAFVYLQQEADLMKPKGRRGEYGFKRKVVE